MLIVTDPADPRPIFRQIAGQIRSQVESGDLPEGEKLPTAASLAKTLGLNRNTVLEAYRLLRDEKVIELRRGRGAIVLGLAHSKQSPELARRLARVAQAEGLGLQDVVKILKEEGLA
ncbi:GntR family transcriptional regulator [Corynebacterium renale]|uniref:DNA-binding transcriptional regulator YhcF (GntR family) n=1 Tax=Corynebacterium renale TaxID=1724 RepID=A0A2A9DSE9_9CORY|nr:GntR family transcriptional regulator [Corynebacterium renale]PFG28860.1 DNA-binding transcriptional regulator YhcF (GntR family) [Corynebacterium renale]SQI25650.1 GntR family transcriptional regulator [Corynebacterium renale]